jgi:hypothetical protein
MDHRPFEDWLLNNLTLDSDENRQLNAHLQVCASCRSLAEVNLALKTTRMVEPADGFTGRFQARLEQRKKALQRRNFWGFLILTLSVLAGLAWAFWPVLNLLVHSPVNLLASWLSSLLSMYTVVQAMVHAGALLVRVVPDFVPGYVWAAVLLVGCAWSLLWVFSLIKFVKLPQGV